MSRCDWFFLFLLFGYIVSYLLFRQVSKGKGRQLTKYDKRQLIGLALMSWFGVIIALLMLSEPPETRY